MKTTDVTSALNRLSMDCTWGLLYSLPSQAEAKARLLQAQGCVAAAEMMIYAWIKAFDLVTGRDISECAGTMMSKVLVRSCLFTELVFLCPAGTRLSHSRSICSRTSCSM